MSGYDTFLTYQAVKLHFSSDSYDFFTYHGKFRCTVNAFENRKDRYFFHKLDRQYPIYDDLVFFLAANFFSCQTTWVRELLTEQSRDTYFARKKIKESLDYTVSQDCYRFDLYNQDRLKQVLKASDGNYPELLDMAGSGELHEETLIVLGQVIGFWSSWDAKISDTILYPSFKKRCIRYAPFLNIDTKKFRDQMKLKLTGAK